MILTYCLLIGWRDFSFLLALLVCTQLIKWWVSISSQKQSSSSLIQQCSMLLSLQTCNIQVIFYPKKRKEIKINMQGNIDNHYSLDKKSGFIIQKFFLKTVLSFSSEFECCSAKYESYQMDCFDTSYKSALQIWLF